MKPWEELSIYRKTFFVGCVLIYVSAEKLDVLIARAKQTYNTMREEKIRKERMN
jgi:hypothetical protein